MFQIQEKKSYRLIRHDKSKTVKNGRNNYTFLTKKLFNIMPMRPELITDGEVNKTFQRLGQRIRVHHLKSDLQLRLGFEGCTGIRNFNIRKLQDQIPALQKCQEKLALNFSGCENLEESLMKSLSVNYLKKLAGIKEYKFYFNGGSMTDIEVKRLTHYIGRSSKALQIAAFSFYRCFNITDLGIKNLLKRLSMQRSSLKKLELDFSRCEGLTPASLTYIASRLKSDFKKLEELELAFTICNVVKKETLLYLGTSIAQMKSIKKLKLNFSYCEEINKDDLKELCAILEANVKQYKELVLNFTGCKYMSSRDKAELRPQFASIPKFILL